MQPNHCCLWGPPQKLVPIGLVRKSAYEEVIIAFNQSGNLHTPVAFGLNEVISIGILTCSLVVMSTVRQGVVLQRSCYYLVVPHDVCRGDHYILLSHLGVFL